MLKACHSEPTSGHFGVTKTYKRMAWQSESILKVLGGPYFQRKVLGGFIFQKKSSGGSVFIKKIVPAHDLEGSKIFRGGPNFAVNPEVHILRKICSKGNQFWVVYLYCDMPMAFKE